MFKDFVFLLKCFINQGMKKKKSEILSVKVMGPNSNLACLPDRYFTQIQ